MCYHRDNEGLICYNYHNGLDCFSTFADSNMKNLPALSFIVPAMNEEKTIRTLFNGIRENAEPLCRSYEIIFIDDGSSDNTWKEMEALVEEFPENVKAIQHRRNFGKANALSVGYREAVGEFVFTMDADLQDDPTEIPRFLEKLEKDNLDIVSGYKQKRYDPWHKVLPSRVFNKIISKVGGVDLHDHNCGFKCYRNDVVKTLPMYGGMHRMVPSIAGIFGFKTGEIVVQHHARKHGESKYGTKRILHGIADIITIGFIKNYRDQPNHALGIMALVLGGFAFGLSLLMSVLPAPQPLVELTSMISTAGLTGAFVLFFLGVLAEFEVWRTLLPSGNLTISDKSGRTLESAVTVTKVIGRKKALVADDDPIVNRVISNMLKKENWDVVSVSSVDEAVETLNSEFSVAFVDVHMPGPSHKEALRQLQERSPGTRLVSFSGDNCEKITKQAMQAGAAEFIPKPVTRDRLIDAANQSIDDVELAN